MAEPSDILERLRAETQKASAFVHRSALRPAVWHHFLTNAGANVRVLLIPFRGFSAGHLCRIVNDAISQCTHLDWCVYNQSVVMGEFDFETLVTRVLPLSNWWQERIRPGLKKILELDGLPANDRRVRPLLADLGEPQASARQSEFPAELLWCVHILGAAACAVAGRTSWPEPRDQLRAAIKLLKATVQADPAASQKPLFAVSMNRTLVPCLHDSVRTIKGDAARGLFDIDCSDLVWAVVDSGIDHRHPAFSAQNGRERIERACDFTKLGEILLLASSPEEEDRERLKELGLSADEARRFGQAVRRGDDVDWDVVANVLRVDPRDDEYLGGLDPHGTHVAGILAGNDARPGTPNGVCPDIRLVDLRVLKDTSGSDDTEFHIISALQYIRHLNRNADKPLVHGVNLSLSLPHSVADYACGQTPICEECDRLAASGVVVVAASGNYGFDRTDFAGPATTGGYRDISITDPGNAESVITVGATHAKYPHRYGVSYFSSRGPTGDGRAKPDLVAPGENVVCPTQNGGYEPASGTSMAAPHASGAAALLMARHPELIGEPDRIKKVLCDCATDLRRSADGQGRGLVDILRAIQSI